MTVMQRLPFKLIIACASLLSVFVYESSAQSTSTSCSSSLNTRSGVSLYKVHRVQPNDFLNIREQPSANSRIVGTLKPDATRIVVRQNLGQWSLIESGSNVGYVNSSFLTTDTSVNNLGFQIFNGCAFPWRGEIAVTVVSHFECSNRCEKDSNCLGFTFFDDKKLCRLISSGADKLEANNRAISGKRDPLVTSRQSSTNSQLPNASATQAPILAQSNNSPNENSVFIEQSPQMSQRMSDSERQRFVQQYVSRDKTILEQVFNYTAFGQEQGHIVSVQLAAASFWVSGANNSHKCVMTQFPFNLTVDIRQINQTAFRFVSQLTGQAGSYPGHYVINAVDGNKVVVDGSQGTQMDRLRKAWSLAFQECPGKRTAF